MRLEVVWAASQDELDGDLVIVGRAVGLRLGDLADLDLPLGVTLRASEASIGKGAVGTGVGAVFEVAEHALNDVASLIGVGYVIRALISRVTQRRGGRPAGASAMSIAALAAADSERIVGTPVAWRHTRTVPLTTDGSLGTDVRDVWVSTFLNETEGIVHLAFYSSTTRYLGSATVCTECYVDGSTGRVRTDDELANGLDAWFGA
jgi:hypothetical protein